MPSFGPMSPEMGNANQILGGQGLQQQGPSSAAFQPGMLPPQPSTLQAPPPMQPQPVPGAAPVPGQLPPPGQMQAGPQPPQGVVGMPPGNTEALKIIAALSSHLANQDKLNEMSHPKYQPPGV